MISGIALAAKQINPATKIIAVEPRGKELGPCLKAKQRLWSNPPQFIDTIAEGIKTQQVIHFLLLYRKRLNFALPMAWHCNDTPNDTPNAGAYLGLLNCGTVIDCPSYGC